MSNTYISDKIKTRLWVLAGGRCQYCNKPLWRDELSLTDMNCAYVAHTIADSAKGPRGDAVLSEQLSRDITNLMLLCDVHHRLIDVEQVAEHSAERLTKMKAAHELRIELATGVDEIDKSEVLLYGANIGKHQSPVNMKHATQAMLSTSYPASAQAIELGMANFAREDDESEYWRLQEDNLRQLFQQRVVPRLHGDDIKSLSVFAMAPQPLLMSLGFLLGDITKADVYQLHREPPNWKWQENPLNFAFDLTQPTGNGEACLVFSLSASIDVDRVKEVIGESAAIWVVSIPEPHNDFLKSREQLSSFRRLVRSTLDKIKLRHGQNRTLHVFPAMPLAAAVEFGRVLMPKADMPIRVYDQNRESHRFVYALDLIKGPQSI